MDILVPSFSENDVKQLNKNKTRAYPDDVANYCDGDVVARFVYLNLVQSTWE